MMIKGYSVCGTSYGSLGEAQDAAEFEAKKRLDAKGARTINGSSTVSSQTIAECTVSVIRDEDGTVASTHRP